MQKLLAYSDDREFIAVWKKSLGQLLEEFLSDIKLRVRCQSALQFEFTPFLSLIYFRQSPQGVRCHITVCSACKCILKHISSVYGTDSPKGVYHFGHEHTKWLSKSQMDLAKRDARHHFHHVFIEISAICLQFLPFRALGKKNEGAL